MFSTDSPPIRYLNRNLPAKKEANNGKACQSAGPFYDKVHDSVLFREGKDWNKSLKNDVPEKLVTRGLAEFAK